MSAIRLFAPLAAAGAGLLALALAGSSEAYPDARVSAAVNPSAQIASEIRPPFWALIHPRLRHSTSYYDYCERRWCSRYHRRRWSWRDGRYYYDGGQLWDPSRFGGPGGYGGGGSITVDCGERQYSEHPISDAVQQVEPGGVIYVRGRGGACRETVYIDRPVTLVGEGQSVFDAQPVGRTPNLEAPAGSPCIVIDHDVPRVEIRDLVIDGSKSGAEACIKAWNTEFGISDASINYTGESSAISLSGGRLAVVDSEINANSYDPAIVLDKTSARFSDVGIHAASTGVFLTPGASGAAAFDRVSLYAAPGSAPEALGIVGVQVRGAGSAGAKVAFSHMDVRGFKTGFLFERGIDAAVSDSRITRGRTGVVSEADELSVTGSAIGTELIGVYVAAGQAHLRRNRFFGFSQQPVVYDPGLSGEEAENWIHPRGGCGFYPRYGGWCSPVQPEYYARESWSYRNWGWHDEQPFAGPPPFVIVPEERREHRRDRYYDHDGVNLGVGVGEQEGRPRE